MCDIVFEKAKGYGETVNRTSDYVEITGILQERFYKKFRRIQKKKHVLGSLCSKS